MIYIYIQCRQFMTIFIQEYNVCRPTLALLVRAAHHYEQHQYFHWPICNVTIEAIEMDVAIYLLIKTNTM